MNELSTTLIAKNILFLKLFKLPTTRWHSLKDKVVNVPINDNEVLKTLSELKKFPRSTDNAGLIPVNLKRKKKYKGNVISAHVNYPQMIEALQYFKRQGHPSYQDIEIEQCLNNSTDTNEIDIDISDNDSNDIEPEENTILMNNYP